MRPVACETHGKVWGMAGLGRNVVGVGLLGVLVLGACAPDAVVDDDSDASADETSAEGSEENSEDSELTDESEPGDAAADEDADDEGADEDEAGDEEAETEELRLDFIEELGLGEPDSTLDYPAQGVSGGEVTLDVYPVEVQDQVMRLALVFYPDYDGEPLDFHEVHDLDTSGDDWPNQELSPELIDREYFKKYEVIRPHRSLDPDGHVQWGREVLEAQMPSGEPFIWWGFLPAPEDEIDVIDLELPQLDVPTFSDVEVAQ